MVKNHKVSSEDGKELLDAVSLNKSEININPGKRQVRNVGVTTLVFGVFLFIFSIIMMLIIFYSPIKANAEKADNMVEKILQDKTLQDKIIQQANESKNNRKIPGVPGFLQPNKSEPDITKENFQDTFSKESMKNVLIFGLSFRELLISFFFWLISILIMIYAVGLILVTGWGRKMGIYISIISAMLSCVIIILSLYHLRTTNWIIYTIFLGESFFLFLFSIISFFTLNNNRTIEALQKETDLRKRNFNSGHNKFRSRTNKMILGICGGLGEYFNVDPVLIRIGAILIFFATGIFPAILIYFICGLIIPLEPETTTAARSTISVNKFTRSGKDRMLLGVCGGLAEYFHVDPVLIRIGTVILLFITAIFPVIVIYFICGIIIPKEPENT